MSRADTGHCVQVRQTRDPITGFRERLVSAELAEVSELKAIELEVGLDYEETERRMQYTLFYIQEKF